MSESRKRIAFSPCQSESKSLNLDASNSSESFQSTEENQSTEFNQSLEAETMSTQVKAFQYRVTKMNGEDFVSALDRPQCYSIWNQGLKKSDALLFGISLVVSRDRPFMVIFQLNFEQEMESAPPGFKLKIGEATFEGEFVKPGPPIPLLGEEVTIRVTKTQFKITPEQVNNWVKLFGTIVKGAEFEDALDLRGFRTDDILVVVKLRKHFPSMCPAYGRKMMSRYPGQPLQCGKCFEPGHLRSKCENPTRDWTTYAKCLVDGNLIPRELVGRWAELPSVG